MIFEHYLLLIIAILPLIYKYSFWLYTIQLKEYRWDRLKEYLKTNQWKSALINIWTVIELPLLLLSLLVFINPPFEIIIFNVLFVFLLIQNLFVFRKILTRKLLKPKITWRLILILAMLLSGVFFDIKYFIDNELWKSIYSYVLFMYLFAPYVILFIIFIASPIVSLLKILKIKKATKKSLYNSKPIKIWITGSYWKSSVKEYLASILEQDNKTLKTPENINSELGVSNIILKKLDNTYKYFIAEMWAYKKWEIALLWDIVNHKHAFLTSIWNQHLWLFWSQKNIINGKMEIVNNVLKNNWILYVNWNNDEIRNIKFNKKINIIKYWNHKSSDTHFKILWENKWKTEFKFTYKWKETTFKVPIIWEHNIINLTWVIAFCYDMWIKTKDLSKYLKNLKWPKNTLNITKIKKYILINDTYNLSEAWLFAWLKVLKSFENEKILIVDDILELWNSSKEIHHRIWKKIAKLKLADKIHYVGINYKSSFQNWLFDWWYNTSNILNDFDKYKKNSVILFEWRKAKKYLDKINKNV